MPRALSQIFDQNGYSHRNNYLAATVFSFSK
jgi:hypothetical protein